MASVWDYDIVLMMVSHLTEAMNRYREGKGGKPGRVFRLHVSDILRFARRGNGSSQVKGVEAALDRLRVLPSRQCAKAASSGQPKPRG